MYLEWYSITFFSFSYLKLSKIQASFIMFMLWLNFILGFNFFLFVVFCFFFFFFFFFFWFLSLCFYFLFQITIHCQTVPYQKQSYKKIKLNQNIYTPTKNNTLSTCILHTLHRDKIRWSPLFYKELYTSSSMTSDKKKNMMFSFDSIGYLPYKTPLSNSLYRAKN